MGNTSLIETQAPIAILSKIIDTVCCSAHEAEYAALFYNAHLAEDLRETLTNLGYPQTPTTIMGDNEFACDVAHGKRQKRGKVMSRNYDWIVDIVRQGPFVIHWQPGKLNLADYFTKDHPVAHYIELRPRIVTDFPDILRNNKFRILSEI